MSFSPSLSISLQLPVPSLSHSAGTLAATMSGKRSRIGRSSSFGDSELLEQLSSQAESVDFCLAPLSGGGGSDFSVKFLKPTVTENAYPSQARVLSVSSPVHECAEDEVSGEENSGGFLEKCYYCKKRIPQNAEIFMYSYMRAFCTSECRELQIALDKVAKKQPPKTKEERLARILDP